MLLYSVKPKKCKIKDLKRNTLILLHIVTLEAMKQYKFTEKPSPISYAAAAAKSLQSCPTLCDSIDAAHQAGSPVLGILQARTLGWVAIFFSNP